MISLYHVLKNKQIKTKNVCPELSCRFVPGYRVDFERHWQEQMIFKALMGWLLPKSREMEAARLTPNNMLWRELG